MRLTRKDLDARLALVNGAFKNYEIVAQGRYGYIGLDLYQGSEGAPDERMLNTLHTGSTRECYDWLGGAMAVLSIQHRMDNDAPYCEVSDDYAEQTA